MYIIITNEPRLVEIAKASNAKVLALESTTQEFTNATSITDIKSCQNVISELLLSLSIPPNIKGFKYLKYLLFLLLSKDDYEDVCLTKKLYPDVAKHFQTTSDRIGRAIRTAINHSCDQAPIELMEKIFGPSIGMNIYEMTNSKFIFGLKIYLQKDFSFKFTE